MKIETDIQTSETKHIFIDIVNYTYNRSVEAQTDIIRVLNNIVKDVTSEKQINKDQLLFIPTGDGMCISLLNVLSPYDIHLQIAISILDKLAKYNDNEPDEMRQFGLRIGINENIDNIIIDINSQRNISGSGINYASRIENLCDKNQILVGNTVYEKLRQGEKYLKSFTSYTTLVKHGLPLVVYQYKNEKFTFLNNEIPSNFKEPPKKHYIIPMMQGYYLANCILYEKFISKNVGQGQNTFSLTVLLYQMAMDSVAKYLTTKTDPIPTMMVKRPIQEQFDYLQSVDFWVIAELKTFITKIYFSEIFDYFSEPYLFINEFGRQKLLEDQPSICKECGIINCAQQPV